MEEDYLHNTFLALELTAPSLWREFWKSVWECFSPSLVNIFTAFPLFVVGVMLLMTSFELRKISLKIQGKKEIYVTVVTALLATVFNMAVGFIGGLILYIAIERRITNQMKHTNLSFSYARTFFLLPLPNRLVHSSLRLLLELRNGQRDLCELTPFC
jgi:hypothetical protein